MKARVGSRITIVLVLLFAGFLLIVFRSQVSRPAESAGASPSLRRSPADLDSLPLAFEANLGQADPAVRFLAHTADGGVLLESNEAYFVLPAGRGSREAALLRMRLIGASRGAPMAGIDELGGKSNYLIGSNPRAWRTNIPNFARVRVAGVYPGIDAVYHGSQRRLEYDFQIAPRANPNQVVIEFPDSARVSLQSDGSLLVRSQAQASLRLEPPLAYQEFSGRRQNVTARFRVRGRRVAFSLGSYDASRPLVIDPTVAFSTFVGGNTVEQGLAVAVDASGNPYITGTTFSLNFPVANAFQQTLGLGVQNAFVTKLRADGSRLLYSTYLGGNNGDIGYGIAVDSGGNAVVAGATTSTDFPTLNPIQNSLKGTQNAFLSKLAPLGNMLVFSTYLGGSGTDLARAVALDKSGNILLTGQTSSPDFPKQAALQGALLGAQNAFVGKVSADGTTLMFSTYLGGANRDAGLGIAADSSANAYVTGSTSSVNFPVANAFQPALAGATDAFVSELAADGSHLVYSSYLGGSDTDQGTAIAVDSNNNAYVTGSTSSPDFRLLHPLQPAIGSDLSAFAAKVAPGGSLAFSTFLGGSGGDQGFAIALDSSANVYVAGATRSADFPTMVPFQGGLLGPQNAFISEIKPDGSALIFSSFLGGSSLDQANGVALDSQANLFVAGTTQSFDFLSVSPEQPVFGGGTDAFLTKITPQPAPAVLFVPPSLDFGSIDTTVMSAPQSTTLMNTGDADLTIKSISLAGPNKADFSLSQSCGTTLKSGAGCPMQVTFTPSAGGIRTAAISVSDNAIRNPQMANLSGNGVAPVPTVLLFPAALLFPGETVGQSAPPQTVTLINNGTATLNISSIKVSGTNSSDFSQQNTCGSSVNIGANCTITVTFKPTATGTRQASIIITDDATPTTQTIQLVGGADFALTLSPNAQALSAGQSTTSLITVFPLNSFNQTVTLSCLSKGLPTGVSCSFLPGSVTLDGTNASNSTVTVTTSALSPPPSFWPPFGPHRLLVPAASILILAVLFFLGWTLRRQRRLVWSLAVLLLFAAGCGGGARRSGSPAGTFNISIQGASGTLTHTVTFSLQIG